MFEVFMNLFLKNQRFLYLAGIVKMNYVFYHFKNKWNKLSFCYLFDTFYVIAKKTKIQLKKSFDLKWALLWHK